MKKIVLLVFLFPLFINALGTNGTTHGITVTPSNEGCAGAAYYWDGNATDPSKEGLRITFFDLNGKQLGNTVDVWNKKTVYSSATTERTSGRAKCEASNSSRFYKCTAYDVTFVNKTPSRIDYIHTNTSNYYVNNDSSIKPVTADYVYYVDINFDSKVAYNPLWYTKDDKYEQAIFKNYFTSPVVVAEYMKIAGVKNIDSSASNEYLFLLEPIVKASSCKTSKGIGTAVLSSADFAFFLYESPVSYGRFNNLGLNCEMPKSLTIVEEGEHSTIGNMTFKLPNLPEKCSSAGRDNFSWQDRTINKVGVGVYIVYGDQVCINCSGKRSAIVYHTINLNQPFLNIDGNTRTLGEDSNWYQKESTIDVNVYNQKPKYTVVLTPTIIKQIREENKNIKYSELSEATFEKFKTTYANIFK